MTIIDNLKRRYIDMIRRCYKPKCCNYKHYGGRGITVCAEWLPENNGKNNFIKWSLEHGYEKNL